MREVAIVGTGMTKFGKFPERTAKEMSMEATLEALEDGGAKPRDIEIAYCGTVGLDKFTMPAGYGKNALEQVGIEDCPINRVENA